MSRLRVAVIGAGNIAQQHLPVLTNHPECEVTLLCDVNAATRAATAEKFGIAEQAERAEDALGRDDIDAVFVLVSVLHVAKVAGTCIAAGIPTFTEKPPGIYSSETAHLAELQQKHGTVAMVGLNRRFYSSHLEARERLRALGEVVSVTVDAHEDLARTSREKFPPLVLRRWAYANGIHGLDLLRFFGGEVAEVEARPHRSVENEFPDSFTAWLRFAGGAEGRAAVDWFSPGAHAFQVRTVGATAVARRVSGSTEWWVRGQQPETIEPDEDDQKYKPGFWKQDSAFLKGVREGKQPAWPAPSLADAHGSMAMIDKICGLAAAPSE
jgi:predicted dehydrogenase